MMSFNVILFVPLLSHHHHLLIRTTFRAMNRGCKSNGGEIIGVFHQRFEGEEDSKHITNFIYTEGTGLAGKCEAMFGLIKYYVHIHAFYCTL